MTSTSIDTTVDGFIVTVTKDGERNPSKLFYTGKENDVCERVHAAFPEGRYLTQRNPAKQISPGVYCLV